MTTAPLVRRYQLCRAQLTCKNSRIEDARPRRRRQPSRGMEHTWMRGDLMAQRTCDVPGCERPALARDYCNAHYIRWNKTGEPGSATIRRRGGKDATCEYAGCGRRHEANGLCPGHLHQQKNARPLAPLEPRLKTTDRDSLGRKLCRVCRQWLPVESYFANSVPKDGLHNRCMRCHRSERLQRNYGITIEDYEKILAEQGAVCKICRGVDGSGKELAVDHDHSCCPERNSCGGCIRGLLCSRCNMGLGYFRDSAELLVTATAYLTESRAQRG